MALSTLAGSFYMVRKIRFFIGVSFYRLVKLVFYIPRALIDSFTLSGASAAIAPRPSALCFSVVSVWFQLGAFPQDPQRVLGARSFFMRSECSDSPFLCVGFVGIVLFMKCQMLLLIYTFPHVPYIHSKALCFSLFRKDPT